MKKLFNRIISVICVFAITIPCVGAAFAAPIDAVSSDRLVQLDAESITNKLNAFSLQVNEAALEKVNADCAILDKTGILSGSDDILDINIRSNDAIFYHISIGEYENIISVAPCADGIEVWSKQDDIVNTVLLKDDGTVYIDGKQAGAPAHKDTAVIANSTTHWSSGPFYGKASDYKYFRKDEAVNSVEFVNAVANLTISSFLLILVPILGPMTEQVIGLGEAMADVYRKYVDNNPTTRYASYKAKSYTAKSGTGFIDNTYGYNYRYDFTFYMAANYDSVNYPVVYKTLYEMITTY